MEKWEVVETKTGKTEIVKTKEKIKNKKNNGSKEDNRKMGDLG